MLVDWELARSTAARLIPAGPTTTREAARQAVTDMREKASIAEAHVITYTGLIPRDPVPEVVVIDRQTWANAIISGMEHTIEPLLQRLVEGKSSSGGVGKVGRTVTGVQVGTAVSWLATRVLGQYDVLRPGGDERLMLVAPNIVSAERALKVDAGDFRLWVALHEQTHRLQFCAVPWMRDHFHSLVVELGETARLDTNDLGARLAAASAALVGAIKGKPGPPLIEVLQGPAARETLDKIVAFMSLLEGHADQVMDAIGPDVVPSVASIRTKFEKRRTDAGIIDRIVKSLLGMDAKLAQYRDGGAFVRTIVDKVGIEGFNTVWEKPANVPTRAEIAAPELWLARVGP